MSTVRIADRKQAEADFHNRRAQDRTACESAEYEDRYPNNKIYSITRQTQRLIDEWMSRHASGATALDYCCGQGLTTHRSGKTWRDGLRDRHRWRGDSSRYTTRLQSWYVRRARISA